MRALSDPIVLRYVVGVGLLLVAAGLVLGVLRFGSGSSARGASVDGAWRTYCGWLAIIPVVLVAIVGGRAVFIIAVAALQIAAVREFASATGLDRNWPMTGVAYLGMLGLAVASLVPGPRIGGRVGMVFVVLLFFHMVRWLVDIQPEAAVL